VIRLRSAWPGGRDAHAQLAGEFGVSRSHERRHLFVADLDEADLVFAQPLQAAEQAVDAVTGITKDAAYAPFMQPRPKEVGNVLSHAVPARAEVK
jgi:hypothetical protein